MEKKAVYFVDGISPRKGLLGVAAYLRELQDKDMEFTRFYMTREGAWGYNEFEQDVVGVGYWNSAWWLLGKRGHVFSLSADQDLSEKIKTAGSGPQELGYLSRLKVIGDELYACGLKRQVYVRRKEKWVLLSKEIISDSTKHGFRDIAGKTATDLHAVGRHGEIWYFDESGWHQAPRLVEEDLECVLYEQDHLCYACGMAGTVLRGYKDTWQKIPCSLADNLWGLACFQGHIYFSGDNGLLRLKKDKVELLDLGRPVSGYRLHANEEELWSIEEEEIWKFDGTRWEEIVCPDNE